MSRNLKYSFNTYKITLYLLFIVLTLNDADRHVRIIVLWSFSSLNIISFIKRKLSSPVNNAALLLRYATLHDDHYNMLYNNAHGVFIYAQQMLWCVYDACIIGMCMQYARVTG